jgi:hypothetical protein
VLSQVPDVNGWSGGDLDEPSLPLIYGADTSCPLAATRWVTFIRGERPSVRDHLAALRAATGKAAPKGRRRRAAKCRADGSPRRRRFWPGDAANDSDAQPFAACDAQTTRICFGDQGKSKRNDARSKAAGCILIPPGDARGFGLGTSAVRGEFVPPTSAN